MSALLPSWLTALLFCGWLVESQAQHLLPWPSAFLASPDGKVGVTIALKEKLDPYPPGSRVYYSIQYQGQPVLLDSPLGLDFKEMPPLARDLQILGESRQSINEPWTAVVGKRKQVVNHANELRLELGESAGRKRRLDLVFRAYNDGVALRYCLPEQPSFKDFRLTSERTEFHFAGNHTIWAAQYGAYRSSQESEFEKISLEKVSSKSILGLPLLVQASETCFAAITEANLTDWAGMYLTGAGNHPYALSTTLSPRPDEPGVLVRSQAPRYSPWRVIMLGTTAGSLIESNLVANLNEPCVLRDTSWIKPGRSAWDRWWCGSYAPDAGFPFGMNTASMNYFTQFAADMGWEYVLVDWTWYGEPLDPNADITKSISEVDLPAIIKFAHDRNVNVIIWLRWNHVNRQLDQAFPLYEKWGIAGVKVDFMDSDDQEMVNFYHRVIKKAAEHHLLVDFHGAYKPTGLQRTYPNYITQEGVMGNEYNKWSSRVTPEHNVTLPFTRMLAGPLDFTPGGFRHVRKNNFKPQDVAPMVMGTRAHQLAMMVVYESPLQVLCDSPYNYRNQPGLDFLQVVPTNWDETRVLNGQVGEFITMARQSGDRWFLGGMTNSQGRTVEIPLSFLGKGRFQTSIYSDSPDSLDFPERIRIEKKTVTSAEVLKMTLAPEGGFAVALIPEK
jgi:alpha-glucosidase